MRKYKEIKEKLWEYRSNLTGDLDTRNTQEIVGWSKPENKSHALGLKKAIRHDLIIDSSTNEVHVYVNFGSKYSHKYNEDMVSDDYVAFFAPDGRVVLETDLNDSDRTLYKEGRVTEIDFSKYL